MVLPAVSQEDLRAHILKALDGREIENVRLSAESREVAPVDGYRKHVPTGRQTIEVTTMRRDPIQDAIDAPDDALIVVVAPAPEMALPAWAVRPDPARLAVGEADETVAP